MFVILCIILFAPILTFAYPTTIANGLSWVTNNQNVDGSWGRNAGFETLNTSVIIDALKMLNANSSSYSNGIAWLNLQSPLTTDMFSRRIINLKSSGLDVSVDLLLLLNSKRSDGGWGGDDEATSMILDTALALQALKAANYSDHSVLFHAVDFLIAKQNADGGWGFAPGYDSNVFVTAHVLKTLPYYNNLGCSARSSIDKGIAYLLSKQNTDGGFGSSPSSVYETALAFDALIAAGANISIIDPLTDRTPAQGATNYLTTAQLANGSWNDDPYSTALALQALANIRPDLSISSLSLSKAMPQEGETITITATIKNTGLDVASNIVVRFYQGDPASGGVQIGADQIIPSLSINASAQASISQSFDNTGSKTIFAVVDPNGLISETSEEDNRASTRLWVATTPDLAVFSEDLKPATFVPVAGTAFTLEYTVRNLGETAADAFTVSLYDGDPSAGSGQVLSTANIPGVTGGGISTGTLGVTLTGEGAHTLYLVADSGSQVTESSETNNTASVTVQIGGSQTGADLAVTSMDITLTPSRPAAGQTVQIAGHVRNQGTDTAFGFVVELFDGSPEAGGILIHSETLSLAPGVEQTIAKDWAIPTGIHAIQVVVDRVNKIVESNETNNRASLAVMTDMVDISLSATDLVFTPSRPVMGDSVALAITVRNTGIRDTGAFTLALYNGDPSQGGVLLQTFPISNVAGDGSQSVVYSFTAQPQTYRFYAVADTENVVIELYETNNLAVRSLTIKGPGETYGPDLVPMKIDLSGTTTDPRTLAISGTAHVSFQNKGDAKITTPFDIVVFEDKDNDGRYTSGVDNLLGTGTNTLALWPEGAGMATIPLSGTVKFLHSPLYAFVDSGDAILEQDETNNILVSCKDCEVVPANSIQPVVKWKWKQPAYPVYMSTVANTPAIINLTDSNSDGKIDENDIPYIVFNTYLDIYTGTDQYLNGKGKLRAFKGETGEQIYSNSLFDPEHAPAAWSNIAVGDIDKDGKPEIIASKRSGSALLAFNNDGTLKWDNQTNVTAWIQANPGHNPTITEYTTPVIADLDGDGKVAIIAGPTVINADGTVRCAKYFRDGGGFGWAPNHRHFVSVADLDMDGKQEIIAGYTAYNSDCTIKWSNSSLSDADGYTAVVNVDDDAYPEIVLLTGSTPLKPPYIYDARLYLLDHTGKVVWGPVYPGQLEGAASAWPPGQPVIADFDGDGRPEIGIRGMYKYMIFDRNGNLKISFPMPVSYLTTTLIAPTVFDLDGDGSLEVLIEAAGSFKIYSGKDGSLLYNDPFSSLPEFINMYQNVTVADVDGDGHAELVVTGYNNSTLDAIRVYKSDTDHGAAPWVTARKIWNQYSYHVTNINDNGSIPQHEAPSWLLNNTFNAQTRVDQSPNPYLAPNLTASYLRGSQDSSGVDLTVRIGNGGAKEAASGVIVTFYDGDPSSNIVIGTASTSKTLNPGEYQDLILSASNLSEGLHHVYAAVDAGNAISECREDDNQVNIDITVVTGLPDLKVGIEDIILPAGPYSEGSIVPITVNVRNIGSVPASGVTARLFNGSPAAGGVQLGVPQIVQTIDAEGTAAVSFSHDTLGRVGTNILYVALDQENSIIETNEANNIALFTIDVQPAQFPNLAIDENSIQLSAISPQEGERVTITATILNRGAATSNIPVRFYLGDPASGGILISEQRIYTILDLGQSATVTASLDTTGLAGQQNIYVIIDPANAITESREDDNAASKTLFIQSAGLASSITLDKTTYQVNETVNASVTITNATGTTRLLAADCFIKDSAGNLIAVITAAEQIAVGPNGTLNISKTWNTGKTLAGNYHITAEVAEEGRIISRANTSFSITPDRSIDAKMTTDKMAYNPKETVALTSVVISQSGNYIFENLTALVTVRPSGGGSALCTEQKTLTSLMPEATFTFKSYCMAAGEWAGMYTARLEVLSGQAVLASSSAGFEVLSTSLTGTGLSGTIAAATDPVYQGREETFGISVTNNGIDDLTGLTVSVTIADPETGAMKTEAGGQAIAVGQGRTITGTVTASTLNLEPKNYLAILRVRTAEMAAPRTLASALFEVKPGIEVTKKIPDVRNVLVWLNVSNAECPSPPPSPRGGEGSPLTSSPLGGEDTGEGDCSLRRALLEQALDEAGVLYRIVTDKKDFASELENIFYTEYLILGDHLPLEDHVADVLAARVAEGKGLLSSLFNRQSLNEPVLGIKFTGSLPGEGYVVEIPGNELGMQGSFPSAGRVLKIEPLQPEEAIAWVTVTDKKGSARYPAALKRNYGSGKVLFLAFDLAMSGENIPGFPALLRNALDAVHTPLAAPYRQGQPVPVEISVKSLGAAFDIRISETYPAVLRLYDPASGRWITDNPWVTDLHLESNAEKTLFFYAIAPEQAGTYALRSEIGYMDNGAYSFYQEIGLDIETGAE